jgi:hypothetical protein
VRVVPCFFSQVRRLKPERFGDIKQKTWRVDDIVEERKQGENWLVGRLGNSIQINKEAFRTVLTHIWRPNGRINFREIQDHIWIFKFSDEEDKRRVLASRPWSFDRQIVVINEYDGHTSPSSLNFSYSPFWIQIHDIPLVCMTQEVGKKIEESLGSLEEVEIEGRGMG